MKPLYFLFGAGLFLLLSSCKKDADQPPPPPVLLKEVVSQHKPAPYYHFVYDGSGQVNRVDFASGLLQYKVEYANGRIRALENTVQGNRVRLLYTYGSDGKAAQVKMVDENGLVFKRCFLTYDGNNRLKEIEWEVRSGTTGYIVQRTLSFLYHSDGNLAERRDRRHLIEGQQPEALYIDRYEQYDNGVNVDDFMLLHNQSEHLVLLPGVRLLHNNPLKVIRAGTGINYEVGYTYTYVQDKLPQQRKGDLVFTTGPDEGTHFETKDTYSYYP